jgi:hypothetical protein
VNRAAGVSPRVYVPLVVLVGVLLLVVIGGSHRAHGAAAVPDEVDGARYRLTAADAKRSGAQLLTPALRSQTFHFAPSVAPADRQAFLDAVAAARPEARQIIGLIDGLVDVHVGPTGITNAIGLTENEPPAGYRVTVDLGLVSQRFGQRGIARTVLHELGHVVDHALVTDDVVAEMDAEIPSGIGCEDGKLGACANREERFAETFAKWALGDIGVNLDVGYKVPPPSVPLGVWGQPLARLAATSS